MFGRRDVPDHILPSSSVPRGEADREEVSVPHSYVETGKLKAGIPAFMLFRDAGLADSNGAARRLIQQGGAYVNGQRIEAFDQLISEQDLDDENTIVLRSGKKRFHKILVQN